MRKYFNQKGSALVLVMSSIIILMAVSTVVVMVSAANINMSQKYNNWTADYYQLDYAAQEQLTLLDQGVLGDAETCARYYLQNGYCQYALVTDFPSVSGTGAVLCTSVPQSVQTLMYDKWLTISAILGEGEDIDDALQAQYDAAMEDFMPDAFGVLYYAYLDANLPIFIANNADEASNEMSVSLALVEDNWFPNASIYFDFDVFLADITEQPQVEIISEQSDDAGAGKQVTALVTLVAPSYNSVEQTEYTAVKVNPLYTNALSVQGDITFTGSGTIAIAGDVVSNNVGHSTGLDEGNSVGIKTAVGSSVDVAIYGNIQSAGDVHLWGDGSSITVNQYADIPTSLMTGFSVDLKEKLYDSDYFFDFAAGGDSTASYTEESLSATNIVPYIYKDNEGGNVFCNNLAIESNVEDSNLTVAGNIWTRDDIQNDGKTNTNISVDGNYIGMRSDADESNKDPNASSAVINNAYLYGGTVQLNGSYIIPGTSWYQFNGVGSYDPGDSVYYQTAESATTQAGEYFQIYLAEPNDENTSTYYVSLDEYYDLYEHNTGSTDTLGDRITRFEDAFATLTDYGSGINVSASSPKYSLGVVVDDDGTLLYDKDSANASKSAIYTANQVAYYEVRGENGLLLNVYTSKTQNYGTDGWSFFDLTNDAYATMDSQNRFYYLPGNASLDVEDNISSGILYVDGDLTITTGVTFYGSIICSGDVTIQSGVTICYDEAIVKDVLGVTGSTGTSVISSDSGSRIARRFFAPEGFSMGQSLGSEQLTSVSANSGERDDQVTRYTINEWKESNL